MKKIKLGKQEVYTLVDTKFHSSLSKIKWHLSRGYATSWEKGVYPLKTIFLHRLIMNCPKDFFIDHINHNKLDNRKINLRICSFEQNQWNSSIDKRNTTGHKGINKRGEKWGAKIGFNKKRIWLGSFDTKKQAILAYNEAAKKYHGEYAYLNDIKMV